MARPKGIPAWNKGLKLDCLSRENHWNWKGGRLNRNGYIFVLLKSHPYSSQSGYIREHRLIMEKHIGRFLKPSEIVHHINGNTKDNRIENLKLFNNNGEHISQTRIGHRASPRRYKHYDDNIKFPIPRNIGNMIVSNKRKFIVKKCNSCNKKFWTRCDKSRLLTKSCSKKCFLITMFAVSKYRKRFSDGRYLKCQDS